MKKVLIFSVAYHPFIGGAEIAVKEITDRLRDIEFHLITVNLDGKQQSHEKIGNIHVYRLGSGKRSKFLFPFSAHSFARRLSKEHSFDVIWSIMASQASIAAAFFKMFYPAIPLLLTLQEGDEETHLKRYVFNSNFLYKILVQPWYRLVFKRADHITVISNYLAQRAREINPYVPIDLIPNGVDIKFFSETIPDSVLEQVRKEMKIQEGDKIIITTSRLVTKNAVGDLIASLQYLPSTVKLAVIGSGELEQQLRSGVRKLNLDSRVVFLGFKEHTNIPKYLGVADVFVRPSLSEGMGNSFIEAMAAGIPVIATNVGGIPDFLKDRETGLFCKIHNPQDIALKVQELLDDKKLTKHIIKEAKKMVSLKYDWSIIAWNMGQIFSTLE